LVAPTIGSLLKGRVDTLDIAVPALMALPPPDPQHIAAAAYFRWQERGSPPSSEGAVGDWLAAEQDLLWAQVPRTQDTPETPAPDK
jgi:hypothetical protein